MSAASASSIRTVIVDDEPLAREGLRLLLKGEKDIEIVAECQDGPQAVEALRRQRPDLLLLDVQMPEMSGFEVLQQIDKPPPAVIFTTAYDEFAVRAFEVHALDYLLKPFSNERFRQALQRARQRFQASDRHLADQIRGLLNDYRQRAEEAPKTQRLAVKDGTRVVLLDVGEISWIEAADYYVRLHSDAGALMMRESLKKLERRLGKQRFARIHRSALVNLDRVRELRPSFGGDFFVILRDGTRLKLARSRRAELERLLKSRL